MSDHVKVPVEFITIMSAALSDGESTDIWAACRDLVRYVELGQIEASPEPESAEPVAILCRQTDESKTEWFDHDPLIPGSTRHKIRANHGGWDLLPVYASPPKQEWIKCSERMPDVNKDFDWEGNIWVCSPLGAVFSVCGISDLSDGWWWMPTGLTKPQPPQE